MEPVLVIDVGTTKNCAIVGRGTPDAPQVMAIAVGASAGMDKGLVVDVDEASRAIASAASEACRKAGIAIGRAHIAIAGGATSSMLASGRVMVIEADKVVTEVDKQAAIDEAVRRADVGTDREIVNALPVDYLIDEEACVKDPLGVAANVLEARVHIVSALATSIANAVEAVRRAGFESTELVVKPIASARAVLKAKERSNSILIDIGGGTTGMVVFNDGSIIHTSVLPIGGNHITRDISLGLKLQPDEAEQLKVDFGCALGEMADDMDFVKAPKSERERAISKKYLCQIIEARLDEVFRYLKDESQKALMSEGVPASVVITGGSARLAGLDELAFRIFELPARVARPGSIEGLSNQERTPAYSTAVGLALHALEGKSESYGMHRLPPTAIAEGYRRIKDWLAARSAPRGPASGRQDKAN